MIIRIIKHNLFKIGLFLGVVQIYVSSVSFSYSSNLFFLSPGEDTLNRVLVTFLLL